MKMVYEREHIHLYYKVHFLWHFWIGQFKIFFIHAAAQNGITTIYLHIFCMWQQRTNDVYMGNKQIISKKYS